MGLIKEMMFTDNYHKITSVEIHFKKSRIRIRTDVFGNAQTMKLIGDQEYTVDEKVLTNASYGDAERSILPKDIKNITVEHVKKLKRISPKEKYYQGMSVKKSKSASGILLLLKRQKLSEKTRLPQSGVAWIKRVCEQ